MLTRHLFQLYTTRTTRLVLLNLPYFHIPSLSQQSNSYSTSAPPEPTLNWRSESHDFDYRCDDYNIDIPIPKNIHGKKIKVDLNPVLGWSSGQRRVHRTEITYQSPQFIDKGLSLPWLPAVKSVLEPTLYWSSELSEGLGAQLEKSRGTVVRRLESQARGPRSPKDGLVRRCIIIGEEPEAQEPKAEEPAERTFVRRIRSYNWGDWAEKALDSEAKTAEAQQTKLSDEESLKGQSFESERKAQEVGEIPQREQEAQEYEQEESVARRIQKKLEIEQGERWISSGRGVLNTGQETPVTGRYKGGAGRNTPENGRRVSVVRKVRSALDSSPGRHRVQDYSGLIRHTQVGPRTPFRTEPKIADIRVRNTSFEYQRIMEDQPTVNTSTRQVKESTKEAVLNDASMGVVKNIGGALPHKSDTTVTEKRPKDPKHTNLNPESSLEYQQKSRHRSAKKCKLVEQAQNGSPEAVLNCDIEHILSSLNIIQDEDRSLPELPEVHSEISLTISELSSTGDGLAVHKNRVYVVPFGVPGDKVNAAISRHNPNHSVAKITNIIVPSSNRDDSLVRCKYFGTCAGCQFQMLPYTTQLEHKRKVVQKSFKNFSNLPPELLPEIGETIASPLQYGYRTKLTPHFNGPRRGGFKPGAPIPNIGFMGKDPNVNLDIEDCPIATDAVRRGMKERRAFVAENLTVAFKRGATLLLRESTIRTYPEDPTGTELKEHGKRYTEEKVCITDHNERSTEYIGDLKFEGPAGSFFQNNSSILSKFTSYIRENLNLPVIKKAAGSDEAVETAERPKYLVDAYCGSGLFSITCGQGLERVWGIDVDKASIKAACGNAIGNNIQNASFVDSPAENIFGKLEFPGSETSLIIDPPKKGCDKRFLDQLLDFAPRRVVYVSCNVHTQARDIGYVLTDKRGKGYKIDSIRGFDFFPQTHHVEGVVVMTKIDQ